MSVCRHVQGGAPGPCNNPGWPGWYGVLTFAILEVLERLALTVFNRLRKCFLQVLAGQCMFHVQVQELRPVKWTDWHGGDVVTPKTRQDRLT